MQHSSQFVLFSVTYLFNFLAVTRGIEFDRLSMSYLLKQAEDTDLFCFVCSQLENRPTFFQTDEKFFILLTHLFYYIVIMTHFGNILKSTLYPEDPDVGKQFKGFLFLMTPDVIVRIPIKFTRNPQGIPLIRSYLALYKHFFSVISHS